MDRIEKKFQNEVLMSLYLYTRLLFSISVLNYWEKSRGEKEVIHNTFLILCIPRHLHLIIVFRHEFIIKFVFLLMVRK